MIKWFRDLLLPTLIVGILGWVVLGLLIPKLTKSKKQITYEISPPINFLDKKALGEVKIEVNDIETPELHATKVHVQNTGNISIKELPIRFVLEGDSDSLIIFNIVHETNPKYEFGKISLEQKTPKSVRFIYGLLNPGDEDIVTFLTNMPAIVTVHAKAEDVSVKAAPIGSKDYWSRNIYIIVALASLLTSFLSLFFRRYMAIPRKDVFSSTHHKNANDYALTGDTVRPSDISSNFLKLIKDGPRPIAAQKGVGDISFYVYSTDTREEILNLFLHNNNLAINGNVTSSTKQEKRLPRNLFNGVRKGSQWSLDSSEGWINATWQPAVNGRYILLVNRTSGAGHDPWDQTIIKINGQNAGKVNSKFSGNMVLIIDIGKQQPLLELNIVIQGRTHPGLAGIEIYPEF